jgi:hypothetical protein
MQNTMRKAQHTRCNVQHAGAFGSRLQIDGPDRLDRFADSSRNPIVLIACRVIGDSHRIVLHVVVMMNNLLHVVC